MCGRRRAVWVNTRDRCPCTRSLAGESPRRYGFIMRAAAVISELSRASAKPPPPLSSAAALVIRPVWIGLGPLPWPEWTGKSCERTRLWGASQRHLYAMAWRKLNKNKVKKRRRKKKKKKMMMKKTNKKAEEGGEEEKGGGGRGGGGKEGGEE